MVLSELSGLHEDNLARYPLRLGEFHRWRGWASPRCGAAPRPAGKPRGPVRAGSTSPGMREYQELLCDEGGVFIDDRDVRLARFEAAVH